jgi:ABC-type transport system involved in multi-copper enzyme maturation permease subunit
VRKVLLIAANSLREHRWPVLILFGWIVLMALASGNFGRGIVPAGDVQAYIVSQALFISFFSAFLAAGIIHNDRKSKRILLVLSKAVTRADYLLAAIVGTSSAATAYALLFGLCCRWLDERAGLPSSGLWSLVFLVIVASVMTATVALFFSTFVNLYVAIAATMLLFFAPEMLRVQSHPWHQWLPGFSIFRDIVRFVEPGWRLNWRMVAVAIVQVVVFGAAAAAIFNRRDLAVPVE